MNFLVTGAAGYIGGFLVEKLLTFGHTVVALDHYTRKSPDEIFGRAGKKLTTLAVDLAEDPDMLRGINQNIDVVFHLAGKNNMPDAQDYPTLFHTCNVTATVNLLEWARRVGVGKFIYPASASCYGTPHRLPTPETYPPSPQSIYAITKYLGESAVLHWGMVYKLPVVSLRLFSVYGPRRRKGLGSGLFISKFLDAISKKQPIKINGDGTQSRDMVYIGDVVAAMIAVAEARNVQGIFNVGTGISIPLKAVIALLGYSNIRYQKRPEGEAQRTKADITKITTQLHWRPKVSIEEGIAMVLREDVGV